PGNPLTTYSVNGTHFEPGLDTVTRVWTFTSSRWCDSIVYAHAKRYTPPSVAVSPAVADRFVCLGDTLTLIAASPNDPDVVYNWIRTVPAISVPYDESEAMVGSAS